MQLVAFPDMVGEPVDRSPLLAAVRLLDAHGAAAAIVAGARLEAARGGSDNAAEGFWGEVLASVRRMAAADRDVEFLSA